MLKYIINIIFLLTFFSLHSQQNIKIETKKKNDTVVHFKRSIKIRFGFDVGKFIWAKLNNSNSYDFYIDTNFYKNYYLITQIGFENHLTESGLLTYDMEGNYFKIGLDYNLYENWLDMDNNISVGFRYALSQFDYLLHAYRINQPGAIYVPQINKINRRFENLSAQWLDFTAKVQVETIKHLYLGYSVVLKYLLNYSKPNNFDVAYIPGFFERNAYSNFGFGMQYFISYQFTF